MPDKTICTVEVEWEGETTTIDEIEAFEYNYDVLAVGDECRFTVVNERRKYTSKLQVGATVRLYLQHPRVNGGARTLKHEGIIVNRAPEYSPQVGSIIKITTADPGWHLTNSCAPLWYNLRSGKLEYLLDPKSYRTNRKGERRYFLDPSWKLKGLRATNEITRLIKQGLKQTVAIARQAAQDDLAVFNIQIEGGDTCFDKMLEYARRYNILVNVSLDGYIQAWRPDFSQRPLYQIRNVDGDERNNVLSARGQEDARTIWTDVECVGEQIAWEGDVVGKQENPNAGKRRGSFYNRSALPFVHRLTFGDGEVYTKGLARREAEWRYKRGIYDSWWVQYQFAEHYQLGPDANVMALAKLLNLEGVGGLVSGGVWWEADTMAYVIDEELGLNGSFYVGSVRCEGSRQGGDLTTITIRKPGLLSASFGVHPNPPIIRSSPIIREKGKTQVDGQRTEVLQSTPDQVQSR